jgi:hypothetical protein
MLAAFTDVKQGVYLAGVGPDDVCDVVELVCTPVVETFARAPARQNNAMKTRDT